MRRFDGAGGSGEYRLENNHTARHCRNQIKPFPLQRGKGRYEKIDSVLFRVIPAKAKAGIQCFYQVSN